MSVRFYAAFEGSRPENCGEIPESDKENNPMAKTKYTATEIKKIVRLLAEALDTNKVVIDKIILYGSYAKGSPRPYSDIDIAVISPTFQGKKIMDIQADLARIFSNYLAVVEAVGYSSKEYQTAEPGTMLGEIKRTGKLLFAA